MGAIDGIGGIRGPQPMGDISPVSKATASDSGNFSSVFETAVNRVEQFQNDTQQKVEALMSGQDQEVHDVVLSAQRSELAFEYFLQVRNKVIQAYQEVMRMQM